MGREELNMETLVGMRRAPSVSVVVACLIGASRAVAYESPLGIPVKGLQGSIRVEQTTYRVDESIDVTVILTNVTKTPLTIDPWPGNWFVQVFDTRMNSIHPKARAGDVMRAPLATVTLQPGEHWDTAIKGLTLTTGLAGSTPLWKYGPLEPGTYWLGAEYVADPDPHHPEAWSGGLNCEPVKIEVAAPPQALELKAGEPVDGLLITFSASKPTWELGTVVELDASLKNIGEDPIVLDVFGDLNVIYRGSRTIHRVSSLVLLAGAQPRAQSTRETASYLAAKPVHSTEARGDVYQTPRMPP